MAVPTEILGLMFGDSPDAVVVAGLTGKEGSASEIDYVNPAFATLVGRPVQALRGRPLDLLVPMPPEPAATAPSAARMQALLRRGDGTLVPVEATRHPIRDDAGQVRQTVHVLRPEREGADHAAGAIPAAIAIIRPDFLLGYVNRSFEDWFACRRERVEGRPLADVVGQDFFARIRAAVERAGAGSPHDLQEVLVLPDGRLRHLRMAFQPAGRQGGVCAFMLDVTEMEVARREAVAASRAKSMFLAHMSHEMRTPLNAVIGFAEMMKAELFGPPGHPKYAEYAADILASGRHLLDLVSDLIDVGRIETGKVDTRPGPVDLPSVASGVLRLVVPEARVRGISMNLELPSGLPRLWADERAVRQILLNLLSNAVKYGEAGGETLLSGRLVDGMVEIAVRDTGIGMREEDLARIGQPFFRLAPEPGMDPDYVPEGNGVGLYVTKSLVDLNGGSITFESRPGIGTTVRVRFPAEIRNSDRPPATAPAHAPSPGHEPVPHRAAE